ncbi:MAG: hypothetical protein CL573_10235 [Alphaproteobacteria bacterium]|nr:hypothetical protein [Alphaproteobacteria bacterium]
MVSNDVAPGTPRPAPLIVRYNRQVHFLRLLAILALAGLCVFIPDIAKGPAQESWRFAGVLIAAALTWSIVTAFRIIDRSPQVQVDENGVFVREWHAGTIAWENIQFIAHSSQVRRGVIASITRTRRKPFLLFNFAELPKVRPTTKPPISWFQFVRAEFAIQEPILQQYGLDTPVSQILSSIQKHIDHLQLGQGPEALVSETTEP